MHEGSQNGPRQYRAAGAEQSVLAKHHAAAPCHSVSMMDDDPWQLVKGEAAGLYKKDEPEQR